MKNNSGFTLLEIIITMALVIVVIGITGSAFNSILKTSGRLVASEESNIEGVVGLEMFRHDLQQAGFGLAHAFSSPAPSYAEATVLPASKLNDGQGTAASPATGNVPRAFASWNDLTTDLTTSSELGDGYNVVSGTDYLAIKATSVGTNTAARKWTYLAYSSGGKAAKSWPNSEDNLTASTDRVIMLNRSFSLNGGVTNTLVYDVSTPATYWVNYTNSLFNSAYSPVSAQQVYYIYGVVKSTDLVMPFNRADYFVARPANTQKIPSTCAPDTGILYKTSVNHGTSSGTKTGKLTFMPLLDCVANMQVVFGWDLNGNGVIEESSAYNSDVTNISVSGSTITAAGIKTIMESADEIRNKLKYVKVYIMAQEGRKDSGFTNTTPINVGDIASLTKSYTVANLTANLWLNYRWKIYRIVVYPKNLTSN
jgi:type II secretory pathway pseudopilin PulG